MDLFSLLAKRKRKNLDMDALRAASLQESERAKTEYNAYIERQVQVVLRRIAGGHYRMHGDGQLEVHLWTISLDNAREVAQRVRQHGFQQTDYHVHSRSPFGWSIFITP